MNNIKHWFSLVKINHLIFSMPFASVGLGLGFLHYPNNLQTLLIIYIIVAIFFARNAALAFNRYIDRNFDRLNIRTNKREIPQNKITSKRTLVFVIINIGLFILTSFFINPLCFYLSFVATFIFIMYSYTKRFTWMCHFMLGLSVSCAPMGAYLALSGTFHIIPMLVSLSVIFWVAGFDIIYALQDCDFDREYNLKSIPQTFGIKKAIHISRINYLLSIILLIIAGVFMESGKLYYIGVTVFSILLLVQQKMIKSNDPKKINIAFAHMNGLASLLFAAFTLIDLFMFYL